MTIPKPTWPYRSETVLTAHPNGQWSKKHKGKVHYFGPQHDPKTALLRWRREWPLIVTGEKIGLGRVSVGGIVADVFEDFLDAQEARMKAGDIRWPTFIEYRQVCQQAGVVLGGHAEVSNLGPSDFARLSEAIAHRTPIARRNFIIKTRAVFNWIADTYGVKPDYGRSFDPPPRKVLRRQRNQRQDKTIEQNDLRTLLAVADPLMRALLYLGINGGFGNSDLAELPVDAFNFERGVIDHYRHKTEARRIVPLWPQTARAVRRVIQPEGLAFRAENGRALSGRGHHGIAKMMEPLRKRSKVDATFYGCRYTFATIAADSGDDHARKLIMGHVIDGVSENYIMRFPVHRLYRITNHVRRWLVEGDGMRDDGGGFASPVA